MIVILGCTLSEAFRPLLSFHTPIAGAQELCLIHHGYIRIRWIKCYYLVYILKQWNNYVKIKLSIRTKYVQLFNFIWLFLKEKEFQGRPRNSFQHILFCHTYHKVFLEFNIKLWTVGKVSLTCFYLKNPYEFTYPHWMCLIHIILSFLRLLKAFEVEVKDNLCLLWL